MAVRPKDRFEAFKRDGFTCQYCGRKAPAVILEVDHVIPAIEGGGDELENLITACWDCNRGKGARSLDARAPVVNIAEQTALLEERAEQLRAYNEAKRQEIEARDAVYNRVLSRWFSVWHEETLEHYHIPWENALRNAITKIWEEEVIDAMEVTARRFNYVTAKAVRYFGGVLKHKIAATEGRIVQCQYCEKDIVLTPEQSAKGLYDWYHVGCKPEQADE